MHMYENIIMKSIVMYKQYANKIRKITRDLVRMIGQNFEVLWEIPDLCLDHPTDHPWEAPSCDGAYLDSRNRDTLSLETLEKSPTVPPRRILKLHR